MSKRYIAYETENNMMVMDLAMYNIMMLVLNVLFEIS